MITHCKLFYDYIYNTLVKNCPDSFVSCDDCYF